MQPPVREDRGGRTAGVPVVVPTAPPDSHVRTGEALNASKREAEPRMSSLTFCGMLRSQREYLVDRRQVEAW